MEHCLNYLSLDGLIIWILVSQYKDWLWYQTFSWSEKNKKFCQLVIAAATASGKLMHGGTYQLIITVM